MKQMNILLVSRLGCGSGVAFDLHREKHNVFFYVEPEAKRLLPDQMKGFLNYVDDWKKYIDKVDLIVFDDTGYGKVQDELRNEGYLVVGGTELGDRLELLRMEGIKFAKECGMKVPEFYEFDSITEGIEFIKANGGRWVMKPIATNEAEMKYESMKELTYVAKDDSSQDLIAWMEHVKDDYLKTNKLHFILQEFKKGVEVATGVWLSNGRVLDNVEVNFEGKKLCTGDLGPSTGEMCNFLYHEKIDDCKIYQEGLGKCIDRMVRESASGYTGNVDINYIVNEEGVWFLEYTCRFGYPAISIQTEVLYRNGIGLGEFLYKLATDELDEFPADTYKWYGGVVVAVPPHPYEIENKDELKRFLPIPITKLNLANWHIHPYEIMRKRDNLFVSTGTGYVSIVTGRGDTIERLRDSVYRQIDRDIVISNMFYRTDLGKRWYEEREKLEEWGYVQRERIWE